MGVSQVIPVDDRLDDLLVGCAAVVPAAMHARHTLQEHREKDAVDEDQRAPEMHTPEELVEHPPGGFRVPVIDAREDRENRARRDHVVEVTDDVVGVVQVEIDGIEGQRDAGQTSDTEHRQERRGEEHRHGKADRTTPEGEHQCSHEDDRRHRDHDCGDLEKGGHFCAHARHVHVVRPDDEREEA